MRIMQSFSAMRNTTNPYLKQLFESLAQSGAQVTTFSWKRALNGNYEVLHLHWPEILLSSDRASRRALRRLAFVLMLLRVRFGRQVIVRTLHNVTPHEELGRLDRALLQICNNLTSLWITLVDQTPTPSGSKAPRVTIAHGDYRAWFSELPLPNSVPGRLLYFGLVRPYKGVENLLLAFDQISTDDLTLRIVGSAKDKGLSERITTLAAQNPRVTARLEYVSDRDLAAEIGQAELLVLPYRKMHNSGAALLGLSLQRPVLVPSNEVTIALAEEVGPGWVHHFDEKITADVLVNALHTIRKYKSTAAPDLAARDWRELGRSHLTAYQTAFAGKSEKKHQS